MSPKLGLQDRYSGDADSKAYLLALQFLLEKVDRLGSAKKIVIADQTKREQLQAVEMVADMQQWGAGLVPGQQLTTVVDTLHFVASHTSLGFQMADLTAYAIQRRRGRATEGHPDAEAAMARMMGVINARTFTYRMPWP